MNGPWLTKVWHCGTSFASLNKTIWLMNDISLEIEFQSKAKGISMIMSQIKSPTHNEIKVTFDWVDDSDRVQKCFFHAYPNHREKFWNNHSMNSLLNIRMSSSQKKMNLFELETIKLVLDDQTVECFCLCWETHILYCCCCCCQLIMISYARKVTLLLPGNCYL